MEWWHFLLKDFLVTCKYLIKDSLLQAYSLFPKFCCIVIGWRWKDVREGGKERNFNFSIWHVSNLRRQLEDILLHMHECRHTHLQVSPFIISLFLFFLYETISYNCASTRLWVSIRVNWSLSCGLTTPGALKLPEVKY